MNLTILYRGPLSSCNYSCEYCPFAKRRESTEELANDRRALARFLDWIGSRTGDRLSIFFTPWGEALVRRWYREAMVGLTGLPQVQRAVVQTNLSGPLGWIDDCDLGKLALWCTYHPGQVPRATFLARCLALRARGVRFSVGVVGLHEHEQEIAHLRAELPLDVYLWINAFKQVPGYYDSDEVARLTAVDPLFPINLRDHPSAGRACQAGEAAIAVDGDGDIRRCHFLPAVIGNIYDSGVEQALAPRPCTRARCRCHLGYTHLTELRLDELFEGGALERVPGPRIRSR
jgi:MoaA/NifB/PqqE/SkfB family radical SAM enzyme